MCIHNTGVDPNSFRMYSSMAVNKTTETFQYGHISQPGSFFMSIAMKIYLQQS